MTTYINTPAGSGTDNTKCTISFWVKQTHDQGNSSPYLFSGGDGASNNFWIRLQSDARLYLRNRTGGSNDCQLTTDRLLRDFNSWYHLVFELDSTQSTAADRAKFWINGVRNTNFDTDVYMTQNNLWHCYGSTQSHIGKRVNDGSSGTIGQFNMSHFHYIDGTAYDASYFGSTDSTTGEWKINTSPNVTYGTRGFFILKDGNSVTDESPNSNNCTVAAGTLTKTEDCPSNVFAVLNPLIPSTTFSSNLSNGNTTIATSTSAKGVMLSTLGASTGKYYFEMKHTNTDDIGVGIADQAISLNTWSPSSGNFVFLLQNGEVRRPSGSTSSGTTFTQNDIIGVAWNATDAEVTFYKNGTAVNSGTAYSVEGTQGTMFFAVADTGTGSDPTANFNFGNGYFGTTAVASAGANASNNGIFEYDVPTGYTALSTKGLNL